MDEFITNLPGVETMECIDMHSTGEPIRIVASYPTLKGTLLEQRAEFIEKHDDIRARLIMEPRGHGDMWGAVLVLNTELVETGEADLGGFFMANSGYPVMCGHAVIAIGRLIVDSDLSHFPNRDKLRHDPSTQTTEVRLHTPCGIIRIAVPTKPSGKSDPVLPISYVSVPSFATGIGVHIPIPPCLRWAELRGRNAVTADFSYGGAFFCIIPDTELGFGNHLELADRVAIDKATRNLKKAIESNPGLKQFFAHPHFDEFSVLYGIMVVDTKPCQLQDLAQGSTGSETGLCFFGDQQIDRSPCGGGVAARVALASAKGLRQKGERWTYHSLISNAFGSFAGKGAFVASVVHRHHTALPDGRAIGCVSAQVDGHVNYTGLHCFVQEEGDEIGLKGFSMFEGRRFLICPASLQE